MVISFIHIPKNGGLNLKPKEGSLPMLIRSKHQYQYNEHYRISPSIIDSSDIVFSIIRNPWDRMVSLYTYFRKPNRPYYCHGKETESIRNHKKIHEVVKGLNFEEFVNIFPEIISKSRTKHKAHFRQQWEFLNIEGELKVDVLLRFENYDKEMINFLRVINVIGTTEIIDIPKLNKSDHDYYTNFYTNKSLIDKVGDMFKDDVEKLDYKFENN